MKTACILQTPGGRWSENLKNIVNYHPYHHEQTSSRIDYQKCHCYVKSMYRYKNVGIVLMGSIFMGVFLRLRTYGTYNLMTSWTGFIFNLVSVISDKKKKGILYRV